MSEQATAEQVQVSAEQPTSETQQVAPSPFSQNAWAETPAETAVEVKTEDQGIEKKREEASITDTTNEEILEPNDWLKREFEVDDAETLKQQIKEYKELKSKPKEDLTFADDQSRQIYELLREGGDKKKAVKEFLETQEKLETLVTSEVNEDNAGEIIKLGLKLKHKDLTDKEIEHKYNKQYAIPKEPVKGEFDDDDEFAGKHAAWKERADDIRMDKIIDAKTMKPDLEKAKSELVLPEITKNGTQQANEPDPKKMEELRERFLNKLESDYNKTEGFSTQVKDELVEIPVAFKIPDEDKVAIKGRLHDGFEVDEFINSRWFGEKGEPKIEQIISDIYQLENLDKVLSGVANNAASLRLLEARKQANNTDLNGKTHQNTFQPNADGKSNISPFAKNAWSEKPPAQLT